MKKLIAFMAIAMCFVGSVFGQATQSPFTVSSLAKDTLTNADTAYLYSSGISASYDIMAMLTQTKISGTVGGTAILQGSFSSGPAGYWATVRSDVGSAISGVYQDSVATVTNGTASYYWILPKAKAVYPYYRIRVITSGTQVSAPVGRLFTFYRKP